MNDLKRLLSWLGLEIDSKVTRPAHPESNGVYTLLETGQRAKRAENYEVALDALNRASQLAESVRDQTASAVITLHIAEVYIQQGRWAEAEQVLLTMRYNAQNMGQRAQLAYTLSTLGTLSQARGDWTEARAYYEQALKVAQNTASLGGEARAQGHLADTYLEEGNASYAVHLLREALPKLNSGGDVELSSYFVGLLGRGMILSGQDVEGERMLHRALRLAEQMNYRRFERMWLLELGERSLATLRYDDALRHFERVLPMLVDVTPEKVRALCRISKVHLFLQETDQALIYARQAADMADLLADPWLLVLAQAALGMALRVTAQSVRAIHALEKAVEGYRQLGDHRDDSLLVEILRNLAAAQADVADDERATQTYQQALELARTMDSPLESAQTHLEVGLMHAQRKQMQAAIQAWSAALTIYEAERNYAQVARLHCDIASARRFVGQGQRAIKDIEQALVLLNSIDDPSTRGTVLSNAANAYADRGDIESADAFFTEAITIASKSGNFPAEATRRGNYGWFLLMTSRAKQAVATLEHAIRISQQQQLPLQVAVQTSSLALAHRMLGNLAAAMTYHEQALELAVELRDSHWRAVILADYADSLSAQGRTDDAEAYYKEVHEIGAAQGDVEIIVRALTGKARVALEQGQIDAADSMAQQAVIHARKADMRRLLAEALNVQSQQKAAANHPEESLALWNEAKKLFAMLHMPRLQPEWLNSAAAESST